MNEEQREKQGPCLGLRLVEGMSGIALKIAERMNPEDLAKPTEALLKTLATRTGDRPTW